MLKKKNWWLIIPASILLLLLVFSFFSKDKYLFKGLLFGKLTPTVSPSPVPTAYIFFPDKPPLSSQKYVEMAKDALVAKLGINSDDIHVVNITEKKWSDTSLGCPEKGKFYAQVITPGFIIELEAGGEKYIYHAGLERVVTCENS